MCFAWCNILQRCCSVQLFHFQISFVLQPYFFSPINLNVHLKMQVWSINMIRWLEFWLETLRLSARKSYIVRQGGCNNFVERIVVIIGRTGRYFPSTRRASYRLMDIFCSSSRECEEEQGALCLSRLQYKFTIFLSSSLTEVQLPFLFFSLLRWNSVWIQFH